MEFTALHLNAHWFGETAMFGSFPFPLAYRDIERARETARVVRRLNPDFIFLNEAWCHRTADTFVQAVNAPSVRYPHQVAGPFDRGLGKLLEQGGMDSLKVQRYLQLLDRTASHVPRTAAWVTGHAHWTTRFFTAADVIFRSGLHVFGPSNSLLEVIVMALIGKRRLFGSGTMILSRYPLFNRRFVQFSRQAGLETLTKKGGLVAQAKLPLPRRRRLTLATAHHQEGDTPERVRARWAQIEQEAEILRRRPRPNLRNRRAPVLLMADMNVISAVHLNGAWHPTPEYTAMVSRLGLRDVFRHEQITYDGTTPFARRMSWLARDDMQPQRRIDYCFVDRSRIEVLSADVLDEFRDLSDHKALLVRFQLAT